MDSILKEFILPWQMLISVVAIGVLCALIQIFIYAVTIYEPKVKAAYFSCEVAEIMSEDSRIKAKIKCGAVDAKISNADLIAAYLKHPRPLSCTFFERRTDPTCKMD